MFFSLYLMLSWGGAKFNMDYKLQHFSGKQSVANRTGSEKALDKMVSHR